MRNYILLAVLLLAGCTSKVNTVEVVIDHHFNCMVMCEYPRDRYQNTKYDGVRFKVEEFCYKQCNKAFSGKKCE